MSDAHHDRPKYGILPLVAGAVAANVVAQLLVPTGIAKREYAKSTRPPFAPPPWAFGVAWPINNVLTLWGNWSVLNAEPSADRSAYIRLQAATWILFMTHGLLRFRLRSPILGALNTFTFTALAAASAIRAARIDRTLLASYSTLIPWLVVASALSACQLGDPDPLFERSIDT
ncbi:MAG TPA: tryptophan-rich sensory protein [Candidatus Tumulicola sp.]|jgi:tryptophan-rich sensory protein